MHISVIANDDRTERDRKQLRALNEAVYPPEDSVDETFARFTWANTELSIVIRLEECGDIVAHAGVLARECLLDGQPTMIGGVGGVKSHPAVRGMHLGQAAMTRAAELLDTRLAVDFALLVCPGRVVTFYERLGWSQFTGDLWVEQPDGRSRFTLNQPMVLPVRRPAPSSGTIDLLGFPW